MDILFYLVQAFTAGVLVLAANTAFNGFPMLASILARDRYAPRQLYNRGDRLVYSNGVVLLALAAIGLIVLFNAELTRLIQLYIIGVFVSFTPSQAGHGQALAQGAADARGAAEPAAHPPLARHQLGRRDHHRDRPRHRADHQVHARRLAGDHRDCRCCSSG